MNSSKASVLTLRANGKLKKGEYKGLQKYFQLVMDKIERGRSEYGMDYLARGDDSYAHQLSEELADLSGWSAMRFLKLQAVSTHPKIVYISGPYRAKTQEGIDENRRRAEIAAIDLWRRGYWVICAMLNTPWEGQVEVASFEQFVKFDCYALQWCDVIYMLIGWEGSEGARMELEEAKRLGLEVMYEEEKET